MALPSETKVPFSQNNMHCPRVLIVDDSPVILGMAAMILEEEGMEVFTHDRSIGIGHLIIKHKPDVVLLDINMPVIQGSDVLDIIRGNPSTCTTRVLLHSSADTDTMRTLVNEKGADGFIAKTSGCQNLPNAIRRTLAALS